MAKDALLAATALRRFGLGPRPGDIARIAEDPRGAVLAELDAPDAPAAAELGTSASVGAALFGYIREEEDKRRKPPPTAPVAAPPAAPPAMMAPGEEAAPPARAAPAEPPVPQRQYIAEVGERFRRARAAEIGLRERLVWFWSNHFAVSIAKGIVVRGLAGVYEREAIRPFVLGRFADMLTTVERHPAMLFYLDNQSSIGPRSKAGSRRGVGLNENLAREILELHTLGVNGGYKQADVGELARALTGWTFIGPRAQAIGTPGSFHFEPSRHDPGDVTVLGKRYPAGGIEQGLAILADLARHPSTARHIAGKLARHMVADGPPPALVDRLARVFLDTDGDLGAVTRALVKSEEAWSAPATKLRSPQDYLIGMARATGFEPRPAAVIGALAIMGQPLWNPPAPNGHPDDSAHWLNPKGFVARLDIAAQVARATVGRVDPVAMARETLGEMVTAETTAAMARAESREQALAILLASPEFQRR